MRSLFRFAGFLAVFGAVTAFAPAQAAPARACQADYGRADKKAHIGQIEWLGTTWAGTDARNATVEERWTTPASGAMLGMGRTLRDGQMRSFEFLCIVEREGSLAYIAMPNARMPATVFMMTSITADSVTFENPAHDYPRLIRYARLPDGSLQTTISAGGEERAQSVVLRKQ
jgi:hypothetical protein